MRRSRHLLFVATPLVALCLALLTGGRGQAAPSPAGRCQAAKNALAGRYAACRQNAEARYAAAPDSTRYSAALAKCARTFERVWQKAVDKAAAVGATCIDAPLTAADFKAVIDEHTYDIADALGGAGLPQCSLELVTCQYDLFTCDGGLDACVEQGATCAGGLDACNGQVATCANDLDACTGQVATYANDLDACNGQVAMYANDLDACNGQVATCDGDLAACNGDRATCAADLDACRDQLAGCGPSTCGDQMVQSGEQCDDWDLANQTCASLGFPGGRLACARDCTFDTRLCFSRRFIQRPAAVIDIATGLEWERKIGFGDPNLVTNTYSWGALPGCSSPGCPNGTAFTDLLGFLNTCTADPSNPSPLDQVFFGRCDWRIPTILELRTLVDLAASGCGAGSNACIAPDLGPTSPDCCYVSNTTDETDAEKVLGVRFSDGAVVSVQKAASMFVRAVRSAGEVPVPPAV